jgi:threonine aldolase
MRNLLSRASTNLRKKQKLIYQNCNKNFSSSINTDIKNYYEVYTELRSDVKTIPTEKMRRSVLDLNFGDDSAEEDPTMNKLCEKLAELSGKERGLFLPTGTMANIVGLNLNANRDDYIIQGERSHLNKTESDCQIFSGFKRIVSKDVDTPNKMFEIESIVNKENSSVDPKKIKIIAFENSHNYNGGKILNTKIVDEIIRPQIKNSLKFKHLKFHLDGSRVLNAAAALKADPKLLTKNYDTVNICLSKGLGAPCGSVLLLDDKDYQRARKIRHYLGGDMRQDGFLAAPALVALEDWRERFESDHYRTRVLAEGLSKIQGLNVIPPETNIINIYPDGISIKNEDLELIENKLEKDFKVLVYTMDKQTYIRAVVHHQVSMDKINHAIESFEKVVKHFYRK